MIDIFNLQPTTISRDLKGKYICLFGKPKVGKTTFAAQAPNNLLLAFEKGYNAISGIKAQDINRWADFKMVLKQLERPEAQEMYDTVTIDTVGIMWEMCEQYICAQNQVTSIGDIPWGKGYSLCKREFESCLRKITMLGYGLIIIAHVDKRIEKKDDESEIEIVSPAIPKRAYEIVNQLVDIIGYIDVVYDDDGSSKRILCTRSTPTVMAGSRFPYLPPKIPFGYKELTNAVADAIEKSEKLDGAVIVDSVERTEDDERSFEEVQDEGRVLWTKLVEANPSNAQRVMKIVENIFGRQMKLSEIQEDQKDLFELVIAEMKTL
jgi:hypothetical protein